MKRILLVGASSAIAYEVAKHFIHEKAKLFLIGRDINKLHEFYKNLKTADNSDSNLIMHALDFTDYKAQDEMIDLAWERWGGFDYVFFAYGEMQNNVIYENNISKALNLVDLNVKSYTNLLLYICKKFDDSQILRDCSITVISSPAGDRGRSSNYIYGSSKAFLSTFMSGLRQKYFGRGLRINTIKPGFIDTPLTAGFKKNFLWSKPSKIAPNIKKIIETGNGEYYLPKFWWLIALLLLFLPNNVFNRLKK